MFVGKKHSFKPYLGLFCIPILGVLIIGTTSSAVSPPNSVLNFKVAPKLALSNSKSIITINAENPDQFYSDFTTLSVSTNNPTGYTMTMSDSDNITSLKNTNLTAIPSITQNISKTIFPTGAWGFSLDDNNYQPVPASTNPITISNKTTPAIDNVNVHAGVKTSNTMVAGNYKTTLVFSAVTNYVPPNGTFGNITTMQEMTHQICTDETTPTANATETTTEHTGDTSLVPETTLTDTRDGKTYVVRKLSDGNCWMSQNLALSPTAGQVFTSADTDLDESRTFMTPFPGASAEGDTWNEYGNDGPHYIEPKPEFAYFQNGITPSSSPSSPDKAGIESAGNYYNWPMAVAGLRNDEVVEAGEAFNSICPKGWKLPTPDNSNTLFGGGYKDPVNSPFNFNRAGSYEDSLFTNQGNYGMVRLSKIPDDGRNAYVLGFDDASTEPVFNELMGFGISIRCVAR